jgi:hypothetical protein
MDLLVYILIGIIVSFCIAKEVSFARKEAFYLKKIDDLTNKIMSRDYESYLYAQKKEWNPTKGPKEENPLMEDFGTVESFLS